MQQRLIIIAGKGGVGRTTVSAALGLVLARRGRRTLLAHVRSWQRLEQLFDSPNPIGEEIVEVSPYLWAVNMNPRAAIREIGLQVLRFRSVYRLVLENRIIRSFLRAVPALEEYSMIGKAWYHTTERLPSGAPRFDTVIFDGPATGHLISMLRIPQIILDTVSEGPLTRDAQKAQELLADRKRACMWLVTLAEEMAATEAVDLFQAARDELRIAVDRLVVNRLYPPELGERSTVMQLLDRLEGLDRLGGDALADSLRSLVPATQVFAARRRINERYLRHLSAELPLDRIELPHLFTSRITKSELMFLADHIEASFKGTSESQA